MNNIKQEVKSSLPMLLLLITADARRRVKQMLQKSSGGQGSMLSAHPRFQKCLAKAKNV
jgi:hypothetical protein